MQGNHATIYVEVEPVPQPSGNVVKFPEGCGETLPQPSGNVAYTSQQLAEGCGVSRQAWAKDWLPYFLRVAPETKLKSGRKYTELCRTLSESLADAKAQGRAASEWLENVALPTWGDELFVEARQVGAIVPAALSGAASARSDALAQAQNLQSFAGALLQQVGQHLAANSSTAAAEQAAISEAAIVASEMAAILREQQLRAKVRAEFEAQQQAAHAAALEAQLSELRGGTHAE